MAQPESKTKKKVTRSSTAKKGKKKKILIAASEVVPFAKTGGLADVAGSLPKHLKKMGHEIVLVMPRYYSVNKEKYKMKELDFTIFVHMGALGTMYAAAFEGVLPGTDIKTYFIEHEGFFGRDGLYNDKDGEAYLDNDRRFVFFSRAVLELAKLIKFKPDIIHTHDWHTAIIPVFINTAYREDSFFKKTATILTIHNLQHQGQFYAGLMNVLDIGWEHFHFRELEHNGETNLLKGGLYHATLINTVSKGYAEEIKTEEFGWGLHGVLQDRSADLRGIVNGIDYDDWNPGTDKLIPANYTSSKMTGKNTCKEELQKRFNLPVKKDVPLFGIVSRLASQKGIDILAEAIHRIMNLDIQLVLLGTGETWAHFFFGGLPNMYPDKFGVYIGYDNTLAHQIEAGADFFLMPSRFEPCGLNQLYSLRYGTLPVVRATGGLNDTIENFDETNETGTGFKFYDLHAQALYDVIGWAVYTWYNNKKAIRNMRKQAMKQQFSWRDSALEYDKLYQDAYLRKNGK